MNFTDLPNLASKQLGASILFATDEWFASADNAIQDSEPEWKANDYTPYGKWMDGWECRRRRTAGHDWCIIKLGLAGIIKAIEVDTAYFTGNYSPKVSIFGAHIKPEDKNTTATLEKLAEMRALSTEGRPEGRMGLCATTEEIAAATGLRSERWNELVSLTPLGSGYEETRRTVFHIPQSSSSDKIISHIRVNMGPDGGIARIRVYGEVVAEMHSNNNKCIKTVASVSQEIDLAAIEQGGLAIACSNKHYGHPRNLIAPGRGNCMGDGWETARQPLRPAVYQKGPDGLMVLPGYDWALLRLGMSGLVTSLEVDTHYYSGNYPESCMIEACLLPKNYPVDKLLSEEQQVQAAASATIRRMNRATHSSSTTATGWKVLLPRTRLGPDARHFFYLNNNSRNKTKQTAASMMTLNNVGPISHIKLTIYPDGGVMRVRVLGYPVGEEAAATTLQSRL